MFTLVNVRPFGRASGQTGGRTVRPRPQAEQARLGGGLEAPGADAGASPHWPSAPVTGGSCDIAGPRGQLLLYALAGCTDGEASDVEAHVLGCDGCFADLQALDRAGDLIRAILAADSPVRLRVLDAMSSPSAVVRGRTPAP